MSGDTVSARSWLEPALSVMMGERGTCDVRFSLQGAYASDELAADLRAFGIANTAVTIHGHALNAAKDIPESEFVDASADAVAEIRNRFTRYLEGRALPRPADLLILDMEPEGFSPRDIGSLADTARRDAVIGGYRRRISTARAVLRDRNAPDVKFGLYQVVVPDGKGRPTGAFGTRMGGYDYAGRRGMYDELDYLCPVLYQRFGPGDGTEDELLGWIDASTRQGIDASLTLTRGDGRVIPLCPLLTFWVANSPDVTDNAGTAVSPDLLLRQLRTLRRYRPREVEIIVLWAGSENAEEPNEPVDFRAFLRSVGDLPPPGCG